VIGIGAEHGEVEVPLLRVAALHHREPSTHEREPPRADADHQLQRLAERDHPLAGERPEGSALAIQSCVTDLLLDEGPKTQLEEALRLLEAGRLAVVCPAGDRVVEERAREHGGKTGHVRLGDALHRRGLQHRSTLPERA
jgi:hypothetical protein